MRHFVVLLLVVTGSLLAQAVPEGLSATDWSSIRAAYDAGRHAAHAVAGGHQARNPGQRWSTRFDGRGFLTTPDGEGWTWGLELVSYGAATEERDVARPPRVRADGPRVTYHWDDMLDEWFVNGTNGLEHGYTVHQRPPGAGALTLSLRVRGELVPEVAGDGRDVVFTRDGAATVTYAGLLVVDANGRKLPARFEAVPQGLRLSIDERGARYPLTVDPVAQQAYLKASNTGAGDRFGISVAVSGDTVVVGADREDSSATGVDGNQADNSAPDSGAAYVFVRNGVTWTQQAYLKAANTVATSAFGQSVAVSGDTIVVGMPEDGAIFGPGAAYVFVRDGVQWSQQAFLTAPNPGWLDRFGGSVAVSGDTVVVGAEEDDGPGALANASGAAYVFVRSGGLWTQDAYLRASNAESNDHFGSSVAVSSNTVVVGAPREDSAATGINGIQASNGAADAGAAYVFVRGGTTWTQQAYLKASNTDADDRFGSAVAISCDTVVVGALGEASIATGVGGNPLNNSAPAAGAAYVFVRSGATWSQQAYLKASTTDINDAFGQSVAVSGDMVVVGAYGESGNATGIDGNQADDSAPTSGAAYVFVRSGVTWSQLAYLKASNTAASDVFGWAVAVSGDTVVVGAYGEDSNAIGVNGNQASNGAGGSGAAYVFDLATQTVYSLVQQAYVKPSNTGAGDAFGSAIAVSGDTVVIGAHLEDSAATGSNGNQADNSADGAGAVYVFVRNGLAWTQQAYLKASNPNSGDLFGYSVALSGDTLVVGALGESSNATGIGGNQASNTAQNAGAVYVFVRSGATWSQQAYVKASNTASFDRFGYSVALSADTLVVGAPSEASGATGIGGNQADNSAFGSGAAYVFVRSGGLWAQQAYLKASNTGANDGFGASLAVSGDTVVVGATNEDSGSSTINGNQGDNSVGDAGAAYVFVRVGTAWSQQSYLKPSNPGATDWFGYSVAVVGDTVVVGAPLEDSVATGINGNQVDNNMLDAGAAYVFVRGGTAWTQQAYLKASYTGVGASFGQSVAMSGNTAVVGAIQSCTCDSKAGGAFVFARNGAVWSRVADLRGPAPSVNDFFGSAVAVSGDVVVVGAPNDDSNAVGIDGNPADNSAGNSGGAHIFYPSTFAAGCAGSNGTPELVPLGEPRAGQSYALAVTNLNPAVNLAVLVFGTGLLPPPGIDLGALLGMPGCMLYDSADILVVAPFGVGGTTTWTWSPVSGVVGATLHSQALCLDPTVNAFGFTVSNAVTIRIVN